MKGNGDIRFHVLALGIVFVSGFAYSVVLLCLWPKALGMNL